MRTAGRAWSWDAEDFIAVGDRTVAVLGIRARPFRRLWMSSASIGAVWTLGAGERIRPESWATTDQGLKAVGL